MSSLVFSKHPVCEIFPIYPAFFPDPSAKKSQETLEKNSNRSLFRCVMLVPPPGGLAPSIIHAVSVKNIHDRRAEFQTIRFSKGSLTVMRLLVLCVYFLNSEKGSRVGNFAEG
jgi:hypothetical protein